jgi:hypothetical protein
VSELRGILELACDLGLAQNQRIQTGRHRESVTCRILMQVVIAAVFDFLVEFLFGIRAKPLQVDEDFPQMMRSQLGAVHDTINFEAIAGGEDHDLPQSMLLYDAGQSHIDLFPAQIQRFTEIQTRGLVVGANAK